MKIHVKGIEIHAFHGVFEEERKRGTHFVVDITAEVINTPQADDLSHTVDYQTMYQAALDVLREPVNLIETIASKIGWKILETQPMVERVQVHVHKIKPLLMPHCAETSVEMTFSR